MNKKLYSQGLYKLEDKMEVCIEIVVFSASPSLSSIVFQFWLVFVVLFVCLLVLKSCPFLSWV